MAITLNPIIALCNNAVCIQNPVNIIIVLGTY